MVHHCCTARTDFVEGVRALLIDKRGQAKWDPPRIEQVYWSPIPDVSITSACFTQDCAADTVYMRLDVDTVHNHECCRKHDVMRVHCITSKLARLCMLCCCCWPRTEGPMSEDHLWMIVATCVLAL